MAMWWASLQAVHDVFKCAQAWAAGRGRTSTWCSTRPSWAWRPGTAWCRSRTGATRGWMPASTRQETTLLLGHLLPSILSQRGVSLQVCTTIQGEMCHITIAAASSCTQWRFRKQRRSCMRSVAPMCTAPARAYFPYPCAMIMLMRRVCMGCMQADLHKPIKHFRPRFPPTADPSLSKASALFAAFAFQKRAAAPQAPPRSSNGQHAGAHKLFSDSRQCRFDPVKACSSCQRLTGKVCDVLQ